MRNYWSVAVLAGWLTASTTAVAQTAVDPRKDDAVMLSPFVIDASADRGYESANTLSGTRMSTPSKYVGAAVAEITQALMTDLSLTSFQDLIDFAPNSSAYNGGGVTSDTTGNSALFSTNYSVRGLLVQSMSRDFISTRAPDDAYNSEQFSFTRGPNSILFGVGNPGGIANSVSKRAKFTDSQQVALRADTNESARASFDVNKVMLKDRIALRVSGVKDENHTNRKPSDRAARRIYGTVTLRPFASTTLRASGEHGTIDSLNVRPWPAADGYSAWEAAGRKDIPANLEAGGAAYATVAANPAGSPTVAVNTATLNAAGYELQQPFPFALLVQNSAAPLPLLNQMGFILTARPVRPGGDRVPTLLNPPIPYTANVLGYGSRLTQDIANHTLFFEQRFGRNFFIEAVVNRQRTNNWNNYSSGNQDSIYLDRQRTVLTYDNRVIPNPNYGRYLTFNSVNLYRSNYVDQTERLTASYALDLKEKIGGTLGRLLGRHNAAALGERVSADFSQAYAWLSNATPEAVTSTPRFPRTAVTNIQDVSNHVFNVTYITPGDKATYAIPDLLPRYPSLFFDTTPLPAARADGVTPAWIPTLSTRNLQETRSKMAVVQDFFWDDKVVTTFGFRSDDIKVWLVPTENNPAKRNFTIDARTRDPKALVAPIARGGSTYTQGVVVTPLRWLGLFYNRSSSVVPPGTQVDIFGETLPNGKGEGQDYGVKFSFLDGAINGSLARYTTDYRGVPSSVFRVAGATNLILHKTRVMTAMNNAAAGGPGGPPWDGSDPRWAPTTTLISSLNDVQSRGYEFSVTANPSRNWRITANISHQKAVSSNYGVRETQWVEQVAYGYFNKNPQYLGILTGPGLQNNNETIAEQLQDMRTVLSLGKSLNGKADARQAQYSANFITGYDFVAGRLKGFGLGGNYRWRKKPILGYAYMTGRTDLFDTSRAFFGDDTHVVGAFLSYRFRKWGTSVRIQLNANGLNNDNRLHPYTAVDGGNGKPLIARYSVGPGRNFALTTTFDF